MKRWGLVLAMSMAGAAGAVSLLSISPATVELSLAPGRTHKGSLVVRNSLDQSVSVSLDVADGWAQETGRSVLPPDRWLSVSPEKPFTLGPGRSRRVRYRAKLPSDFKGETMAFVFFRTPPQSSGGSTSVRVGQGIPIYAAARGTESAEVRLIGLTATPVKGGRISFKVTVRGGGNIHVRPEGEVRWAYGPGDVLESIPLGFGPSVFPGARAELFARTQGSDWPEGRYRAEVDLSWPAGGGETGSLTKTFEVELKDGASRVREGTDG